METKEKTVGVASERLAWLAGRAALVRVRAGACVEDVECVYQDALLLGRSTFLLLRCGNVRRVVNTESVLEVVERE